MAKKDKNIQLVVYLLIGIAIGAVLTYFLITPRYLFGYGMGPSMMWGQSGFGMMQYMQAYRNTVDADCNTTTAEELEKIGDDVMEQMIGDEKIHERIDETHPNIDATHLMIGRIATGCY